MRNIITMIAISNYHYILIVDVFIQQTLIAVKLKQWSIHWNLFLSDTVMLNKSCSVLCVGIAYSTRRELFYDMLYCGWTNAAYTINPPI